MTTTRRILHTLAPLAVPAWLALVVYGGAWLNGTPILGDSPNPPAYPRVP
jgi:hypothetical protein